MLSFVTTLLAFAGPPTSGTQDANAGNRAMVTQLTMMLFIGVVFWLMFVRPQNKKAAQQAALIKQLKRNDKVTTSGGLVGTVVSVRDDSVTLRTGDSTLEVTKNSISQVTEKAA